MLPLSLSAPLLSSLTVGDGGESITDLGTLYKLPGDEDLGTLYRDSSSLMLLKMEGLLPRFAPPTILMEPTVPDLASSFSSGNLLPCSDAET